MSKRVLFTAAALLACVAVAPPARAVVSNPNVGDVYCLTNSGKIYRIPYGSTSANLELTIPNFSGEWFDFDPGSGEFIAGPDTSAIRNYVRLPQNLSSAGVDIPNTGTVGGNGGSIDRFAGYPAQPSDLLVADSNPYSPPNQIGVFRIKPNGTSSIVVPVGSTVVPSHGTHPAGSYLEPEDVEQDWSNGDIYVSCTHTATLPGAVLRFSKTGVLLDHYDMPSGVDPHCLVFDNRDVMPNYELIVASPNDKKIYAIDIDLPQGSNRVVFLRNSPNNNECDDLAISPSGKLIYPGLTDGKVYQVELTAPYNYTTLATVPGLRSIAFVSRNKLASQDVGLTVGNFTPMTGPTGKPGVQVKVTDPEFSSGIVQIHVTGTNLVVYDKGVAKTLPYYFYFDERREVTTFTFISEKINPSAGASIQVEAHDTKGLCGDPIIGSHPTDTGPPRTTRVDTGELLMEGVPVDYFSVQLTNGYDDKGVGKFTLDTSLGSISVTGDSKTKDGGTIDLRDSFDKKGKLTGDVKIALEGTTTLLLPIVDWMEVGTNANSANPKQATLYFFIEAIPVDLDPSLSDNFDDNTRASKWGFGTIQGTVASGAAAWDSSIPVLEQNKRLEITPKANASGDHYNGYLSVGTFDFTGQSASVEVVQIAGGDITDTDLCVGVNGKNFYLIEVEYGKLYFTQVLNGTRTEVSVNYSASTHRFWRILHDASGDKILFQTSNNGTSWTTQRTIARQMAINAMKVELSAGTWKSVSSPGKAIFDNLEVK